MGTPNTKTPPDLHMIDQIRDEHSADIAGTYPTSLPLPETTPVSPIPKKQPYTTSKQDRDYFDPVERADLRPLTIEEREAARAEMLRVRAEFDAAHEIPATPPAERAVIGGAARKIGADAAEQTVDLTAEAQKDTKS